MTSLDKKTPTTPSALNIRSSMSEVEGEVINNQSLDIENGNKHCTFVNSTEKVSDFDFCEVRDDNKIEIIDSYKQDKSMILERILTQDQVSCKIEPGQHGVLALEVKPLAISL